ADMTVRTATLEARYLTGDRTLFDTLVRRFETEIMPKTGPEFIVAKMAEREERHRQMGNTRYVVEPNIKDGKGGLCDLHVLTGRADEKLTFEVQPELAARLHFADRPGMLGVERMMKRYFLVAKD